jgi:membrane protein
MISDKLPLLTFIPLISFLLLASIMFHVFLQSVGTFSPFFANELIFLLKILDPVLSFSLLVILIAFIYRLLPDTKLPWKELIVGASVTSALFLVGELFLTFYIGRESSDSLFGTASAITALLLWVYYSSYIFFFGASFTIVYSKKHGYLKEKESTS